MRLLFLVGTTLLPSFVWAQQTLTSTITTLTGAINGFVKAGVALALLVFVWGVAKTIIGMNSGATGSEKAITEGKQRMVWGIVGLFVIVCVWGLVALLGQLFGVSMSSDQETPVIQIR
jgi:hypothetical protein